MTGLGWFLTGMGTISVISVAGMACVDREFRESLLQVLLVMAVGPAALVAVVCHRGPRATRVSVRGLQRFCQQVDADMEPAWVLSYQGRGVMFIRRRTPGGWINNIPNRATRADNESGRTGRSRRDTPIHVVKGGTDE